MTTPRHCQLGLSFTNHHARLAIFDGRQLSVFAGAALPAPFDQLKTKEPSGLAEIIGELRRVEPAIDGHRQTVVSLGDEDVFTRILTLPPMPWKEVLATAPHELESDLPLKVDEMYVDLYRLRELADGQTEYMAFAVSRSLIHWLVEGLQLARLRPRAIETISLSLGRLPVERHPYLTVDIGSDYASMAAFADGLMHVNTSVAMHDEEWRALVNEPVPTATLEQLQSRFSPLLSELIENIQATIRYYQNRDNSREITAVYLSGSGAQVPHLDLLLNQGLRLPVRINHPGVSAARTASAAFLPAIGASLFVNRPR